MTGSRSPDDEPPLDRTQAFRPEGAAPERPAADLPRIPGITLHFEVARGGMGVVYSGRQDFLDRRVAVKLLSMDLAGEKFAQRFQREAKLLAGIKHQNIVACHSAGTTDDGQSYLVMEFVDGPSLKAWIVEQGALPVAAALRLTRSVAQALAHAFQLGVIHRDVKPENILLESVTSTAIDVAFPYVPKLVDLGLARMTSETAGLGLTSPGSVMGTPSTMSPEQFDDPDSVDFRTDIYGLGCALFEMLVGAPAYRGNKLTEIVARKRQPVGPDPCQEAPHVPVEVGALVCSMLAADRDDRPASYRELDERLAGLLATLPAEAPRAKPAPRVVGDETAQTMVRGGAAPPAAKSGPGLLRTAEIDFLQAGMAAGGTATPAFRGGTVVPQPTEAPPATTAPPAASGSRQRPVRWALAVAGAAVLAVGIWFATRGDRPQPAPVSTNQAPVVRAADWPTTIAWKQALTLVALGEDPDGDPLSYRWSGSDEVAFNNQQQNTIRAQLLDGLPGETFTVRVAVDDGHHPPVVTERQLTLAEQGFPSRPFLVEMRDDPRWTFVPPDRGVAWTKLIEMPVVSCRAGAHLQTATTALGTESFWKLTGRLGSRPADEDPSRYAATGVRVSLGNDGWSLICRREGDFGVQWSIELRQEQRLADVWETRVAVGPPRRVQWLDPDDAEDYPYAEFELRRRRDELLLRFGQGDQFEQFAVPIPAGVEPHLTLWVDHGSGEFRDFTLW